MEEQTLTYSCIDVSNLVNFHRSPLYLSQPSRHQGLAFFIDQTLFLALDLDHHRANDAADLANDVKKRTGVTGSYLFFFFNFGIEVQRISSII